VTSDAGLLLPRDLDERLGVSALIEQHLTDPRTGHNRRFPLPDLFRPSIYCRLAGYENTSLAERLTEDPAFRMLASPARCGPIIEGEGDSRNRQLRPPSGRKLFDSDSRSTDPRAHRATRGVSDPIERTGPQGGEDGSGSIPAGVALRWGGLRWRAAEHAGSAGQEASTTFLSSILNVGRAWLESAPRTRQRKREEDMGSYQKSWGNVSYGRQIERRRD
jgi:hypothetical protein